MPKTAEARVRVSIADAVCEPRWPWPQSTARGKRPRGFSEQHDEEGDMAGQDLPFRD